MPLTILDYKGIPALRRERIEAAVVAGGRHQSDLDEGWIATDPFRGDVRVIITGPHGFERREEFAIAQRHWAAHHHARCRHGRNVSAVAGDKLATVSPATIASIRVPARPGLGK